MSAHGLKNARWSIHVNTYMGNDGMGFPQGQPHFAEDLIKSLLLQEHHEWFRVFIQGVHILGSEVQEGLEFP